MSRGGAKRAQPELAGNAVHVFVALYPGDALATRLRREGLRKPARLVARFELDLLGFLNGADAAELAALTAAVGLPEGPPGLSRLRLWAHGAALERAALGLPPDDHDGHTPPPQPPVLLVRGRLKLARARAATAPRGAAPIARAARFPPSPGWPRPVPPPRPAPPPLAAEPATLAALLARADALVGVRLGARGRDKGAHGARISSLLGIERSSLAEPDWRGEVEIKSIAVARARGHWRLKDTPALAMRSVDAAAKLRRVLWIIRADDADVPGAPIVSWFFQELEGDLLNAFSAARHLRPKGGAGTSGKGWYLRREFFDVCGLMRSLNG